MEKCRHDYRSDGRSYCYCIKCGKEYGEMAKKNGAKQKTLQYLITAFAVEICPNVKKDKFNKAWHKLWCGIAKIGLFKDEKRTNQRGGKK